ncbi:MAG: MMPL family transporter [Defluviicoccus sp.]|nr:MMPL family transporter [Defluviicoccus sp.]
MDERGIAGQRFATRFAERVLRFRWPVILATLVLVAAASSGIAMLEFSGNYRIFFDEDNPQLLALEELENTYGKNENVAFLIVPEDGNATSQSALSAALWLTDAAWKTPYSRRVDSLANFQHTTAEGDDLYVRDLVDPQDLARAEARSAVRAIALADPRIAGSILAVGGDVSVVNVTVELPEEGQLEAVAEVAEFARSVAAEAEERFPEMDLRVVGTVMVNQTFVEASIDSQMVFLPASLLLMALILGVLTRSWAGVAGTGLVIVFSILASVGLGVWAGLPFSPPVSPAPTIVLMIVVANCVHLLVALRQGLRAGASRHDAIVESVGLNLHPVFLASLTTTLGFLSMNFSEVPPYRDLGNFVAFGIVASFVLSVTFLPALLSLLPVRAGKDRRLRGPEMSVVADTVLRHRKALLWGWLAIVAATMLAIPRKELNDVLVHFFDESVEFRQDTDFMDERLSGNTLLEYSLHASAEGGVTDPRFLAEVSNFADWYREQPAVRHVAVVTDTFRQLNKSMHGDDPAAYRIPESQELAAQYLLLYELSLPLGLDLNNQIDRSRSATRVSVSAETLSSKEVLELNARAEAWLKENAPHVAGVNSTGPAAMFAYIGQRNIRAMMVGTAVVLLAISAILLFAFRSLRLGLISIVPNLVPAVLGLGVWGLAVGQVSLSLSVVVAMTVGIVVDDTVHFLSKYRRARLEHGLGREEAVRRAFDMAGQALFTTTVVLVAGFLILVFSPFVPTAQVGILTAVIIAFALIADLSLLPALLTTLDRGTPDRDTQAY